MRDLDLPDPKWTIQLNEEQMAYLVKLLKHECSWCSFGVDTDTNAYKLLCHLFEGKI